MLMLSTCVFMKPYKIFSYMHKPTINKVVQKFGLFIKFGILTLIYLFFNTILIFTILKSF